MCEQFWYKSDSPTEHTFTNWKIRNFLSIGKYLWFWDIRSYPISQSALGYNIISHIFKKCPDIYLYHIYIHIFVEQKYLGNIWKISSEYLKISWDLSTLIIVTDKDKVTILEITLHVFSYFGWWDVRRKKANKYSLVQSNLDSPGDILANQKI